ncbi:MAG: hypothetical protein R3C49_05255 [Planctomycetaceae bacterium]
MTTSHPTPDDVTILEQLRALPDLFETLQQHTGSELAVQQMLRQRYEPAVVTAALQIHEARRKAAGILPHADRLWLTRTGLEQSTSWEVAQHKAARFPHDQPITDCCSGIGVDTAALLHRTEGVPITALDSSASMSLRCFWNNEVWNPELIDRLRTVTADVVTSDIRGKLLHVDPDRRAHRDRPTKRLEQYVPDLNWLQQATALAAGRSFEAVASNFMQKFPRLRNRTDQSERECREATVWFGSLAGPHSFRATHLLPGETTGSCRSPVGLVSGGRNDSAVSVRPRSGSGEIGTDRRSGGKSTTAARRPGRRVSDRRGNSATAFVTAFRLKRCCRTTSGNSVAISGNTRPPAVK